MNTDILSYIRNFAIIAHIDHGKSTLADRLMERTGVLPPINQSTNQLDSPRIDRMELETERGVTIKLKAVRLPYNLSSKFSVLNMIDTPGHADFSYEVSRSLAACEGVLLLVDATQGVQAQTLSHLEKARELGLTIVGIVNKIDSPLARTAETEKELRDLGIEGEIFRISALKGEGIDKVLQAVVERIPPPGGELAEPFRALVFDSTFDPHLGT
ncbi:MAG: GTP-binding protein, partial [Patescibacteria group bacterium]